MQNVHDVRDRTAEFFSTVAMLQKQHVHTNNHSHTPSTSSSSSASLHSSSLPGNRLFTNPTLPHSSSATFPSQSSLRGADETKDSTPLLSSMAPSSLSSLPVSESQFNVAARRISARIAALSEKLERLSRLVARKSLFDDPTRDIEELTHLVKMDLESIDGELNALDAFVKREGGGGKEEESKHMATHSRVVVDNLRNSLKKRTGDFMDVLQTRTKNMKEQNTRRKQFEISNSAVPLRQRVSRFDGLLEASAPPPTASSSGSSLDLEPPSADDPVAPPSSQHPQLLALEDQSNDYLTSRATAVESIESTISELASMYTRLTSLVAQQEEVIVRIDSNLDETAINLDRGHHELLKYFDNISGNRMLILKVFAILIAFLVFFMIFVA